MKTFIVDVINIDYKYKQINSVNLHRTRISIDEYVKDHGLNGNKLYMARICNDMDTNHMYSVYFIAKDFNIGHTAAVFLTRAFDQGFARSKDNIVPPVLYDFKEVRFKKRGMLGKIWDFICSLA